MKKTMLFVLVISASFLLAQNSNPPDGASPDNSKHAKGQVTIQGCVSRSSGDYILMKQEPGITYQLQATGKIKLRHYLGQRVEVTGTESATMSTSSDAMNKVGSAAPVTLTIALIKTLDKDCSARDVSR